MKSLFTSIILVLYYYISILSTVKLAFLPEDVMNLLNHCYTSTYINYNGRNYKQLHWTAIGRHFPLLSQKLWWESSRNAQLRLPDKQYLWLRYAGDTHVPPYTQTKLTVLSTNTKTSTCSQPKRTKKMKNSFSRLLGKLRQRETADNDKQKIDTYRHNTGPCNLPITHHAKLATTN